MQNRKGAPTRMKAKCDILCVTIQQVPAFIYLHYYKDFVFFDKYFDKWIYPISCSNFMNIICRKC